MNTQTDLSQLKAIASRIREMREIMGWTAEEMAEKTDVSPEEYAQYEAARADMPFTFIYKSAQAFNMELTELLEGHNAFLSSYTVTRRGKGESTAREEGIAISNLAPKFRDKIAEPYWVRYEYSEAQQTEPIHLTTHQGQEFDLVLHGSLKVQVGDHIEILHEGDSIYYNSSLPHGMIAVNGADCVFCAVVLPGEEKKEEAQAEARPEQMKPRTQDRLIAEKFIDAEEDDQGRLTAIRFPNAETFNFGFDIVDEIARKYPDKLAMLYVDRSKQERRFTFRDIKDASNQCANYFTSLGIKRGDRVMLVLKRHYQFWFSMVAL
ncbi:MAG: helix-turn-helix domain-containing protein, partial [Clostridiales bacterium]|nr:helix-turn-helix domain-containing protein [Clostridiales bacterium]